MTRRARRYRGIPVDDRHMLAADEAIRKHTAAAEAAERCPLFPALAAWHREQADLARRYLEGAELIGMRKTRRRW